MYVFVFNWLIFVEFWLCKQFVGGKFHFCPDEYSSNNEFDHFSFDFSLCVLCGQITKIGVQYLRETFIYVVIFSRLKHGFHIIFN